MYSNMCARNCMFFKIENEPNLKGKQYCHKVKLDPEKFPLHSIFLAQSRNSNADCTWCQNQSLPPSPTQIATQTNIHTHVSTQNIEIKRPDDDSESSFFSPLTLYLLPFFPSRLKVTLFIAFFVYIFGSCAKHERRERSYSRLVSAL